MVGGLALKELNALEKTYLQLLDYKLFVDPQNPGRHHSAGHADGSRGKRYPCH
ncbi:unnamed protein product [Prorocentrum cordatum]|uniref:Uncharacterized protein n=1 Tax=Prorocentrum cordatum TaxID=2364126 RepID=A0ABN9VAJ6_9DINO|nr:unnamed protein product [Polarella glacialis]